MNVRDILDRLPGELAARLESDPYFADVPVIQAVKGNIAREFQTKQAVVTEKSGHRGVAIIVLQVQAHDEWEGVAGAPMKLMPSFQVIEQVELNNDAAGTGKSARQIARHIVLNLKLANFRGLVQGLKCAKPAIEPVDVTDLGAGLVCEQVNFECLEFSDQPFTYCLPPTLAAVPASNPPQVTLASNTPGANIWYTTDGSFPYPGDASQFPGSTSQLYTAAITITPGTPTTVRACAYPPDAGPNSGFIASSIELFTVLAQPTV